MSGLTLFLIALHTAIVVIELWLWRSRRRRIREIDAFMEWGNGPAKPAAGGTDSTFGPPPRLASRNRSYRANTQTIKRANSPTIPEARTTATHARRETGQS
jgi:hypothetical protein